MIQEEFEDTKGIRKSKKNRQDNDQKKTKHIKLKIK